MRLGIERISFVQLLKSKQMTQEYNPSGCVDEVLTTILFRLNAIKRPLFYQEELKTH